MPDVIERVIKGLTCRLECGCMNEDHCNSECPYLGDPRACYGLDEDTLALLEEQEPITPHMVDWNIYECPKCKTRVDKTYNFCKCCGRLVKWDG